MTETELHQILERLERLEAEVRQLKEAVRQFIAAKAETAPAGEALALREPTAPYAADEKRIIPTGHPHIVRIPEVAGGTPLVLGPYNTVWGIVELFQQGMTPEQITKEVSRAIDRPLTLAQVHSALSFYFDNKEEIDKALAEKLAEREKWVQSFLERKLKPKDAAPSQPPPPLPPSEPKPVLYTDHPYIIRIPGKLGGEPIIKEVNKTVRGIVVLTRQGMTPQQIVDEFGGELMPAQVYDALSYYHDHQEEMEVILAGHAAVTDEWIRVSHEEQAEYAKRKREANVR